MEQKLPEEFSKKRSRQVSASTPLQRGVPQAIEDIIFSYQPASGVRLSTSREKKSVVRMERECPRGLRPSYYAERKKWICHMHPLFPPFKRCCLPPTIASPEDIRRVWEAMQSQGKYGYRIYSSPSKGFSWKGVSTLEEFEEAFWSNEISAVYLGDFATHSWSPVVQYVKNPQTNLLQLVWPTVSLTENYLAYLIGSEVSDETIAAHIRQGDINIMSLWDKDMVNLIRFAQQENKQETADAIAASLPAEGWTSLRNERTSSH